MDSIFINDNIKIGKNQQCFIIGEAGVNHNGSLEIAKKLVDAAKFAGVDAVKFQTFKSEELVSESAKQAKYQVENTGKEESQLEMLKRLELSYDDFIKLKKYCDKIGILFLSTAHTQSAIKFLKNLVPLYKVGSGDFTNLPALYEMAETGKPIILSVGMATQKEIIEVVEKLKQKTNKLMILHCTTSYPCPLNLVNLNFMKKLKKITSLPTGYSDHTQGIRVSVMAAKQGACIIEKHFTLDNNMEGPDHKASLEPLELKQLVDEIRQGKEYDLNLEIQGNYNREPANVEIEIAKIARKGLVAKEEIVKGSKINMSMLMVKRPQEGISPLEFEKVIGEKTRVLIKKNEQLTWDKLE